MDCLRIRTGWKSRGVRRDIVKRFIDASNESTFDMIAIEVNLEAALMNEPLVYEKLVPMLDMQDKGEDESQLMTGAVRGFASNMENVEGAEGLHETKEASSEIPGRRNEEEDKKIPVSENRKPSANTNEYFSNVPRDYDAERNDKEAGDQNRTRRQRRSPMQAAKQEVLSRIPMRSLADKYVPSVPVSKDPSMSDDQRFAHLLLIGQTKIPEERKRNAGAVSEFEKFDRTCVLGWYENYEVRSMRHGVYICPIAGFHPQSYMGIEWESGFCPENLYQKAFEMDAAVLADLRFMCSQDKDLAVVLRSTSRGYQSLRNIMKRYCAVLRDDGIAEQRLLDWDNSPVPRRAQKVREYVLQQKFLGQSYTAFQEFRLMTSRFPPRIRSHLEEKARSLINADTDYHIHGTIPHELTLDQCATWIMCTMEYAGYTLQDQKSTINACLSADDIVSKSIAALRLRKCWGCGSTDHGIDKCPTHCITERNNVRDIKKIITRISSRNDNNAKGEKRINAVEAPTPSEDSPNDFVHEGSANEDLLMTFGADDHADDSSQGEKHAEPQEADFDEALVAHIASDLAAEYRVCSISAFDPEDMTRAVNALTLNSDDSTNMCHMCGSYEHTMIQCPDFLKFTKE